MALSHQEAHDQAIAAREADELLRAQARASAGALGAIEQIADGVFRAMTGGPAYRVTASAVVELSTQDADSLVAEGRRTTARRLLDGEQVVLTHNAIRCRALGAALGGGLNGQLVAEAVRIEQLVATHQSLVLDLGGVPSAAFAARAR
jgi:hypothetical protein